MPTYQRPAWVTPGQQWGSSETFEQYVAAGKPVRPSYSPTKAFTVPKSPLGGQVQEREVDLGLGTQPTVGLTDRDTSALAQRYGLSDIATGVQDVATRTQELMEQIRKEGITQGGRTLLAPETPTAGAGVGGAGDIGAGAGTPLDLGGQKILTSQDLEQMFGVGQAQQTQQSFLDKLAGIATRPFQAFGGKAQTDLQAQQTKITDIDTKIAQRQEAWEKSIAGIENQPIPTPFIVGQTRHQMKLANSEITRLQAERDAASGNYERAFQLEKFAYDLERDAREDERRLAELGLGVAEKQLTSAQKRQADFIEDYLKRTEPDIATRWETDNEGNATLIGYDKNTGETQYQKTFPAVGKKKVDTPTQTEKTRDLKSKAFNIARPELEKSRGTDGYVDPNVYIRLRSDYAEAIGDVSEFDDAYASLLSPQERARLGVGKAVGVKALEKEEEKEEEKEQFLNTDWFINAYGKDYWINEIKKNKGWATIFPRNPEKEMNKYINENFIKIIEQYRKAGKSDQEILDKMM